MSKILNFEEWKDEKHNYLKNKKVGELTMRELIYQYNKYREEEFKNDDLL